MHITLDRITTFQSGCPTFRAFRNVGPGPKRRTSIPFERTLGVNLESEVAPRSEQLKTTSLFKRKVHCFEIENSFVSLLQKIDPKISVKELAVLDCVRQ